MAISGKQDSCATFISQFENIEFYEEAEEIAKVKKWDVDREVASGKKASRKKKDKR